MRGSGLWRGGSPGRPPGRLSDTTLEAKRFCRDLVNDLEYRVRFGERLRAGELAPALEALVWQYAFGRPPQSVEFHGAGVSLAAIIAGRVEEETGDDQVDE